MPKSNAFLAQLRPVGQSILVGIIGLVVGAFIMMGYGFDPIKAYITLFKFSVGDLYSLAESLANAAPLILTALTFAIGFRGGLFNIGAEGQLYMGALAAVAVSYIHLPAGVHHVVTLAAAMSAGALWSLPAAFLKLTRGVHEVISTIMFNWIAHFFAFYLLANVLANPNRPDKTISIAETARLSVLVPGTSLTYGISVSILVALLVLFLLWRTTLGFEVRAVGHNPEASHYAGIQRWRAALVVFVLGGLTAGLAGAVQVMGRPPSYALFVGLPGITNLGFDGIVVAMIGRNHPVGILFAAFFFGALMSGGRMMGPISGVPFDLVRVVEGVIILSLAIPELGRLFGLFWGKLQFWRRS